MSLIDGWSMSELDQVMKKSSTCRIEEYLNKNKIDINTIVDDKDLYGWLLPRDSLLDIAVKRGDPDIIDYLLKNGADINKSGEKNRTPLSYAISKNDLFIIKLLISKGADVNFINSHDGNTLLATCVRYRKTEIAKVLIQGGASICKVGKNGKTPLLWAVENNDLKMVTELLDHVAESKYAIHTSFMRAIELQHFEIFHSLRKRDAFINYIYRNGYTPLTKAIQLQNFEFVKELVQNGADVNMTDSDGNVPLILAIRNENFKMVKYLVENGADVTQLLSEQKSLLIFAARNYNIPIFQFLVDCGADLNSVREEIEEISSDNEDFFIYFNSLKGNMKKVSKGDSKLFTGHEEAPSWNTANSLPRIRLPQLDPHNRLPVNSSLRQLVPETVRPRRIKFEYFSRTN